MCASADPSDVRRSDAPRFAVGVCIMIAGVLLLFDNLGLVDASHALSFWPMVFVVVGAMLLVRRNDSRGRFWGGVWLLAGAWMVLNELVPVRVGLFEFFWPIVMVIVGVAVVRRTAQRGPWIRRAADRRGSHLVAVLGESKRSVQDAPLTGGSMTAVLGSCALDLRQSDLPPGNDAVFDVVAVFAAHEITIPPHWTVDSDVVPILGTVEDKRLPPLEKAATPMGPAPRLVLRGVIAFSSLTIKN
jgi:LiaF transmembrane domain